MSESGSPQRSPVLSVEAHGRVCLLKLNRPERRNALSRELTKALAEAIRAADADPAFSVIALTGAGETFCAGADLKEVRERDVAGEAYVSPFHRAEPSVLEVMTRTTKPLLAIVNGPAVAGGFELALACDIRIAGETAWFCHPEAQRGMGAQFASVLLPRTVPSAIAMDWLLSGRRIPAEEAARWGFLNRIVPPGAALQAGLDWAGEIARSAPLSLQRMKRTYRETIGMNLWDALRHEAGPDPYTSQDRQEGIRAFLEKRPPNWRGL